MAMIVSLFLSFPWLHSMDIVFMMLGQFDVTVVKIRVFESKYAIYKKGHTSNILH